MRQHYRGFWIDYDPPPIPTNAADWHFWHDSFDGPGDHRCGSAASAEDCRLAIDEILEDDDAAADR